MSCLHPIWIRVDRRSNASCLASIDRKYLRYRDVRPSVNDLVPVPCGKCIECLKTRQNAIAARVIEEAEKRGSMHFVTLTYDDKHLPLAQSLWKVNKETGEYILVDKGEVIVSGRSKRLSGRQKDFQDIQDDIRAYFFAHAEKPSTLPRYVERKVNFGFGELEDAFGYEFRERLTPTVCRKDVRLWLKNARVQYERITGNKLKEFSYVACSEFGPNTCRPHYHLAFFGLPESQVAWLVSRWTYGFTQYKTVMRVNVDKSNGFQIAGRYIGKYISKGKFDCDSAKDGSAERPRLCQSRGIGASLLEKVRPYMCAFDMFGPYDLDNFFCPSLGRCLTDSEIKQIVHEIPKRLYYCADGTPYKLPVPRLFRQKVFFERKTAEVKRRLFERDASTGEYRPVERNTVKVSYMPHAVWSLVADSIRSNISRNDSEQFREYLLRNLERPLHEVCCDFAYFQVCSTEIKEDAAEAHYINFLNQSVF